MKTILFTTDLIKGKERLMPWRTLFEVGSVMQLKGYDVNVCTFGAEGSSDYIYHNVPVHIITHNFENLSYYLIENRIDAVFIPVTWRSAFSDMTSLINIPCQKIAYFSGGIYSKSDALATLLYAGYSIAKPYLIEAFIPRCLLKNKLKRYGFSGSIAFTPKTADVAYRVGIKNVKKILTGKTTIEGTINPNLNLLKKYSLENKKFYLYTGAPATVRGSILLLNAFEKFAEKNDEALIVFLMRTDVDSDYSKFYSTYKKSKYRKKIHIITDILSFNDLMSFFTFSYAVILPFLVVPSEIPVTFFEVLSCGTPIITYRNGGTTDYLKDALFLAKHRTASLLAKALSDFWNNETQRSQLSQNAQKIISKHPSWEQTADNWIKMINIKQ